MARRREDIERLASGSPVDLVVIGGGITGSGIALDAASRGLRTVLLERRDLANGTSRWSSKLIHGGLRYLRHLELRVAWESARERQVLLRTTAPHLVHALPFVVPLNDACRIPLGLLSEAGIRTGDMFRLAAGSRRRDLPGARRISVQEALRLAPAINRADLRGAILFWDGQVEDDARLVIGIARTAALHGAQILTHCQVTRAERSSVEVRDQLSGASFTVRTRMVVNAAGVWAGELDDTVHLSPSKGVHLIVASASLGDPRAAVITPVEGESARWVGATPCSDGRTIIGVTDDAYSGPVDDEPATGVEEERFLLSVLSRSLGRPLSSDQVIGRFAGFRPLVSGGSGATADLSRHDSLTDNPSSGITTMVGGKLTTYRAMAEKAVDHLLQRAGEAPRTCRTATLPLVGAAPRSTLRGIAAPPRLVRRYGTEAADLVAMTRDDPSLLEPLAEGIPVLGIELLFGLLHEGAVDIDDLLDRRVRLGLVPAERELAVAAAQALLDEHAA